MNDLRSHYSAVILAYGAASDRELGLDGENTIQGVLPSRRIVEYYNGSLDMDLTPIEFNPEEHEHIGIVGNGNIACDIARMFLKDPSLFTSSDTPANVMSALQRSKVNTVQMIGRRGITQAAFSTKEIRELASLDNLKTYMVLPEVQDSMTEASRTETLDRAIGRRTKFLTDSFDLIEHGEHYEDVMSRKNEKKLILRWLRSPTALHSEGNRISGATLQKMSLEGDAKLQRAVPSTEADEDTLRDYKCDVLVKSIGYKSLPMSGVPFDNKRAIIPHEFGCVKDP
mmetsp:Transcript_47332/g.62630  ORF Transcript_47332/g.62630 Transcript_47332/m.62630 type:complete len:284 (-) Transcript_47332:403-1254(-)|eukprot:CAMPEP_0185586390 /NCGR_PEP_ID=MMETSP0434-20130131/44094_1 /TAXON_ID=626734 ORGANISM="Favella taraikaensis, Strain Fe Narragansett Bay" /NCGR_SAMPLE_ID=MMETSP0434 /ASSEMBLY_ACC=CAM_ASM_000379 /LENGTH=283 /DNA_ID=CAMNT_0028207461 /DNA_START=342 /DNA_END=1193 /DNA_ORIENTATION=-